MHFLVGTRKCIRGFHVFFVIFKKFADPPLQTHILKIIYYIVLQYFATYLLHSLVGTYGIRDNHLHQTVMPLFKMIRPFPLYFK